MDIFALKYVKFFWLYVNVLEDIGWVRITDTNLMCYKVTFDILWGAVVETIWFIYIFTFDFWEITQKSMVLWRRDKLILRSEIRFMQKNTEIYFANIFCCCRFKWKMCNVKSPITILWAHTAIFISIKLLFTVDIWISHKTNNTMCEKTWSYTLLLFYTNFVFWDDVAMSYLLVFHVQWTQQNREKNAENPIDLFGVIHYLY